MHSSSLMNRFGQGTSWGWRGITPPKQQPTWKFIFVTFKWGRLLGGCRFSLQDKHCSLTLCCNNTQSQCQCFPHPSPCPHKGAMSTRYLNADLHGLVSCTSSVSCFSSDFCHSYSEWVQLTLEVRNDFRRFLHSENVPAFCCHLPVGLNSRGKLLSSWWP